MKPVEMAWRWPTLVFGCAALVLVACAPVRPIGPTDANAALAGPCFDETGRAAVQFIETTFLPLEATGQRMRELLGLATVETFYPMVDADASQEPGWDVIYVRDHYDVVAVGCNAVDATLRDVRVRFAAGPWFDREGTGRSEAVEHTFTVRRSGTGYRVASRLPPPFVSSRGARSLLGTPPYDKPPLVAFRKWLAEAPPSP